MRTLIFSIAYLIYLSAFPQAIQKFSIDSGGESSTTGGLSILYTIGEVMVQEKTNGNIHVSEGFINGQAMLSITIDPKLILQGPYLNPVSAGLMNDHLRANGYLPVTSPYADAVSVNPSVFDSTGDNGIVDWVWLELRDANDFSIEIVGFSALIQRDGDVVALDGISPLSLDVPEGNYFIVLDHRNHLGVMTSSPVPLTSASINTFNFKSSSFSTYGNNAQVLMPSGEMALWAGDSNNTEQIKFSGANNDANSIKDHVLNDPNNGFNSVTYSSTGYILVDIDLNGQGKFSGSGNDSNIIKDNVLNHPANGFGSPTYTIQPTVPPKN